MTTDAWTQSTLHAAREDAIELSSKYPGVYRVYQTPSGNHWCRQDDEPLAEVDGVFLRHVEAYLYGKLVRA